MTIQMCDTVTFENKEYQIEMKQGKGLFDPSKYGLNPVSFMSACWNGYLLKYEIIDDGLWLRHMFYGFHEDKELKEKEALQTLFGKFPKVSQQTDSFFGANLLYEDIDQFVPFTGAMLLARGRVPLGHNIISEEIYSIFYDRDIVEVMFEQGIVSSMHDLSAKMEELRNQYPVYFSTFFEDEPTPEDFQMVVEHMPKNESELNLQIKNLFLTPFWSTYSSNK